MRPITYKQRVELDRTMTSVHSSRVLLDIFVKEIAGYTGLEYDAVLDAINSSETGQEVLDHLGIEVLSETSNGD
jgi:hypothetical protein